MINKVRKAQVTRVCNGKSTTHHVVFRPDLDRWVSVDGYAFKDEHVKACAAAAVVQKQPTKPRVSW